MAYNSYRLYVISSTILYLFILVSSSVIGTNNREDPKPEESKIANDRKSDDGDYSDHGDGGDDNESTAEPPVPSQPELAPAMSLDDDNATRVIFSLRSRLLDNLDVNDHGSLGSINTPSDIARNLSQSSQPSTQPASATPPAIGSNDMPALEAESTPENSRLQRNMSEDSGN